ncbi:hypothetical protein DEIPH_ctg008orf0164 [Deinococcus phoenicis]|uniref:Uncharacterized protein n=1 Tax=Deinococcus phoenicis TaxID=1476583 RepID=A0A016QTV2_9DEIO|nr:hypothetical protein [Deinococcus phoenicis]EYB69426.1 hypothetical protein DEIPH_ctg008orf0164 [Deinococcus phoenicis]
MKPRLLLLLALTGLPTASAAPKPHTLTLQAGQTASLNGAQLTLLRFTDSRCPPRALCVMAGNVTAKVFVRRGQSSRLYTVVLPGQAVGTLAGKLKLTAATRAKARRQKQVLTFTLD